MRILFDGGAPVPLRDYLSGQRVDTAHQREWATLSNAELLAKAEAEFDLLVTTDRRLRDQQNLSGRKLAVLVLPTTNWLRLRTLGPEIAAFVRTIQPGEIKEFLLR